MESNNPWRIAQTQSLRDEAAKRGIKLIVTDAQGQTAKQVSDVEDLITRKVDLILLAPREFEGLAPALEAAKRAKIPVILIDREAAGKAGDLLQAVSAAVQGSGADQPVTRRGYFCCSADVG
jgi:ribose transport system substrate-binding protein